MHSETRLIAGAMTTLALATSALVVLPYLLSNPSQPTSGTRAYTPQELRGRQVYIENGCIYCHSQQPRAKSFSTADFQRGWGRASVAGDYVYDKPALLGTMRTGPDLFNIGARQPSEQWHLGHLFQPRAYVADSIMPSYPFLFDVKPKTSDGELSIALPQGWQPAGGNVVPKQQALDLVAYLKALDHTHPVLPSDHEIKSR